MNRLKCLVVFGFMLAASVAKATDPCANAWAAYNQFKERNKMEEWQYPLTLQGGAVRGACGADALPAPPDADQPPKAIVRKPHKPLPPPPPYQAPQNKLPPLEPVRPPPSR